MKHVLGVIASFVVCNALPMGMSAQGMGGRPSALGPVARTVLTRQQEIALAGSAAPDTISRAAGMFVFDTGGYVRVRASTNGFECLVNRDSFLDGYDALKPSCLDAEGARTILPVLLRIGRMTAAGLRADSIFRTIGRAYAAGEFVAPSHPGLTYMLQGDVGGYEAATGKITSRVFPPHLMIYAPGIKQSDLGVTESAADADARLPMIYSRGPQFGYIIVRVPPTK